MQCRMADKPMRFAMGEQIKILSATFKHVCILCDVHNISKLTTSSQLNV